MNNRAQLTPELEHEICDMIAEGLSLNTACAKLNCSKSTFLLHVNENRELADQYTRSISSRSEIWAEEIIDIADDNVLDVKEIEKNGRVIEIEDHDVVNRARLRVDSRKWILSKLQPKKYGDKIDVTSAGEKILTSPIEITFVTPKAANANNPATE
jgi:hypothetical protein